MRIELTNNKLYLLREDIKSQCGSAAFFYFNKQKIDRFFSQNKVLLNILDKNISQLQHKYCKKNEDGKFLFEGPEGDKKLQFDNEELKNDYTKEMDAFLTLTVYAEL